MKKENEIWRHETEEGKTFSGNNGREEIPKEITKLKEDGEKLLDTFCTQEKLDQYLRTLKTAPKEWVTKIQSLDPNKISPSIIDESLERFFVPKKKSKDPKKVIAALRGEITKKQKEIDMLKKIRDYEDEDFKQRGDEIRFLTNRNLWQRIINKKYR